MSRIVLVRPPLVVVNSMWEVKNTELYQRRAAAAAAACNHWLAFVKENSVD